jgi:hypothetical protein
VLDILNEASTQDDVIGPREVNHLEGKHLNAVVTCVSEGDMQSNLPEGDELLCDTIQVICLIVIGDSDR